MSLEKESFVFYRSFFEALQDLKDKERLKLYDAICDLALNEKETKLIGISKTIFTLIRPQIISNTKKYKDGQKGGRPKKETTGLKNKKTTGYNEEKPNENVNDNENVKVNENENENENVSDSCIDGLQEIIDFYNKNIGTITPYGMEILADYKKEMNNEVIILAMKKAVESNKRTIQYIKGILNNWHKKGIKTILEAEQEDINFKNKSKDFSKVEDF